MHDVASLLGRPSDNESHKVHTVAWESWLIFNNLESPGLTHLMVLYIYIWHALFFLVISGSLNYAALFYYRVHENNSNTLMCSRFSVSWKHFSVNSLGLFICAFHSYLETNWCLCGSICGNILCLVKMWQVLAGSGSFSDPFELASCQGLVVTQLSAHRDCQWLVVVDERLDT